MFLILYYYNKYNDTFTNGAAYLPATKGTAQPRG